MPDKKGAAAERALMGHLAERRKSAATPVSGGILIKDLWPLYRVHLVSLKRAESTLSRYDAMAEIIANGLAADAESNRPEVKGVGWLSVLELGAQRADEFFGEVEKAKSEHDAKACRTVLSGMMSMAVRLGAREHNPIRETKPIKIVHANAKESLTRMELHELVVAVRDSDTPCPPIEGTEAKRDRARKDQTVARYCAKNGLRAIIPFFATTGARPSEGFAILLDDLDLDAGTVKLTHKVARVKGKGLVRVSLPDDPKNKDRVLTYDEYIADMLREHIADISRKPNPLGLLFPSYEGTLRDPTNFNDQWRRVRSALGLGDVTLYNFRKTVGTEVHDELGRRAAADQLGHTNLTTLDEHYVQRHEINHEVGKLMGRIIRTGA
ncbi:site-specific integrase [Segniliparus rugosus]|uniref:site-specific integrase n=1 Tax=Segniliparus rugosus TaxID=286804 RepID=UPI0001F03E9D|nr:tyrosine-type recombinase/integrase [Segniliparus rugosus]